MNRWLLRRLEMSPNWIFYEWEVRMYCDDLPAMLDQGLLIRDLEAERVELCFTKYGQRLHLVKADNSIFGADTENPYDPITELDSSEIVQYRFDIERWLLDIRTANALLGTFGWVGERLFFLGERMEGADRLALLIGFFTRSKQAVNLLFGLLSRLPAGFDGIMVTTLLFDGLPLQEVANLERLGIFWVPRLDTETLRIPRAQRVSSRHQPSLAVELEEESEFYGFKCRVPVLITGEITKTGSNVVLTGNTEVWMGDSPFALFLRLVLELYTNKWGAVSKVKLQEEGYLSEDGEFQDIHRLRNCFTRSLVGLDPKEFIESFRPKTLRISIHPKLVSYNKKKLLAHDNELVRRLVQRLPDDPQFEGETMHTLSKGISK
jgi:hypothetical protein